MSSPVSVAHLTRRETAKADLLAEIAERPGRNKMAVITDNGCRAVPTKTRANQYRLIDDLIARGLVENRGDRTTYALHVTDAGRVEVERWAGQ